MKLWEKIFYENRNEKRAWVAIQITGKLEFKMKKVTKDIERHTLTGSIV